MGTRDFISQVLQFFILTPLNWYYRFWQWSLDIILSPTPPPPGAKLHHPRVAVIGAGLTGVAAAAHCVGHGFDARIFEAGGEELVGGIWAKVNNTSGLQIHSGMYRFHPSVSWKEGYPNRKEIVEQIRLLWKRYGLDKKTFFNTKVEKVYKNKAGKWVINDEKYGLYEGVIAAIGTCGDPEMPHISGMDKFKGEIYHSSELDGKTAEGKNVVVIGGGASAIEALEFVAQSKAKHTFILARSEKWIIPRNPIIDAALSMNVYGGQTALSWVPEWLLRVFFYRDLKDLAPPPGSTGIFEGTPMVNSAVFDLIRNDEADWLRGDIKHFEANGVRFNKRAVGTPKGGPGRDMLVDADMVIMATGYQRPSLNFLPDDCFEEGYEPPNWYMQCFPPTHVDALAVNCTYVSAIGVVGNWHIGIYTRFLLMYLVDPLTQPMEPLVKLWINWTRFLKQRAPTGAFDFVTYSEFMWWFVFTLAINPFRWKWVIFILFGLGKNFPLSIVENEDKLRNGLNGKDKQKVSHARYLRKGHFQHGDDSHSELSGDGLVKKEQPKSKQSRDDKSKDRTGHEHQSQNPNSTDYNVDAQHDEKPEPNGDKPDNHKSRDHKSNDHKHNEHKHNEHKHNEHKHNEHKHNEHKHNEHKSKDHQSTGNQSKDNKSHDHQPNNYPKDSKSKGNKA